MTEHPNNSQNPAGILLGMWANSINFFSIAIINRNYAESWEHLQNLMIAIPPECQSDVEKTYLKTEKIMNFPVDGFNYEDASRNKNKQIREQAPSSQRELMKEVIMSLYNHGWINKNFNAQPKYEKKGHL